MTIRDIEISAKTADHDVYYEPPAHVLNMTVIGGDAHLAIYECGAGQRAAEPVTSIEVRARSLLLALVAAIDDDQRDTNGDSSPLAGINRAG
jgi:hypothetical protein